MQFDWLGNTIHLDGLRDTAITEISSSQLNRLQATNSISAFYHLQLSHHTQENIPDLASIPRVLSPLL